MALSECQKLSEWCKEKRSSTKSLSSKQLRSRGRTGRVLDLREGRVQHSQRTDQQDSGLKRYKSTKEGESPVS